MKKVLMLFAAGLMLASCNLDALKDLVDEATDKLTEIQTAKDNQVVYLPLNSAEKAVAIGEGISFASKNGAADFKKGQVKDAYFNTSNKNDESYLKFNLAKDNALRKLEDVTITLWVKNVEEFQKGGIFSVNGKIFPTQDWPSLVFLFDNKGVNEETQEKTQQINGRIMFKTAEGNETNLWLATWDPAFAVYDKWCQIAFTYVASTGVWALYVDSVKVTEAEYGDKMAFGKCIPEDADALYIGGWASLIEKYEGFQDWMSYFSGGIDEIRIFNKALTEAEVAALYREELNFALL
jgi:hypothetical protein